MRKLDFSFEMAWFLLIMVFLIALASTSIVMKIILKKIKWKILFRQDRIKKNKPYIPAFGGLAIFIGFIFTLFAVFSVLSFLKSDLFNLDFLLAALLSLTIISFLGLLDDLIEFKYRIIKPLLVLFSIVPIVLVSLNNTIILNLPLIGTKNF